MDRIKLICADIDGTLLDDNKRVLPQVKESLRKVAESGVRIALASGRMPAGVELVEKELGIPCIKICNAGTCILLGNQCITMKYLLPDVMEHIYVDIAKKNNLPLWIFREREWYVTDVDSFVERETEIIKYQPKVVRVEPGRNRSMQIADCGRRRYIKTDSAGDKGTELEGCRSCMFRGSFAGDIPSGGNKSNCLVRSLQYAGH